MQRLTDEQTAARGGVILVLRFAVTSILNYLLGVALAWILVPAEFGVVGTAQALLLLCGLVLGAGVPWALASQVAGPGTDPREHERHEHEHEHERHEHEHEHERHEHEYERHEYERHEYERHGHEHEHERAERERTGVAALFRTGLVANTAAGAGLAAALLTVQVLGLHLIPSTSPVLIGAAAATLPVLAFNAVLAGMLQGSRRFGALGALQSVEVVAKSVVAVVLAAVAGMGADGVAVGFLAGACTATAVGLWSLRDLLPGRGKLAAVMTFRVSVPFWVGSASLGLLPTADLLGLHLAGAGSGVTTATLAAYQVCGILARAGYYLGDALIDAVFPFIARRRGTAGSHDWFLACARWLPLGLLPLQAVFLLAPSPVLTLFFPDAYVAASGLLRVLGLGTVALIGAGMLMKALYANDEAALVAPRTALAGAVEVGAVVVLVPRWGAVGAAWAYTLGSGTAAVLLALAYAQVQARIRPLTAPRTVTAVRYLLCLAGCGGILTAAQHRPGPVGGGLIVFALAAFYLLAVIARLFGPEDRRRAGHLVAVAAGVAAAGVRQAVRSAGRLLAGRAG